MESSSPGPRRIAFDFADGIVAGWRWPRAAAPRLLFCHANGFCASAYKIMLARLGAEVDVIAIDLRGHGRTTLPAEAEVLRDWRLYAGDVRRVLERLASEDDRPIVAAGHSLGAVACLIAAAGAPRLAGLALVEPVFLPAAAQALWRLPFGRALIRSAPLVRNARGRRAEWPDRALTLASYGQKPLFRSWATGALEDYLEDGLVATEGRVRLACAPAWEAATFAAPPIDFWPAVRRRTAPMAVLAAESRASTLPAGLRARLRGAGVEVVALAGVGHLLPMEAPEAAAAFIASRVGAWIRPR